MTSRISFFKMLKEEFKHHLVSVFLVILAFLGETMLFYFDIQSLVRRQEEDAQYIREALASKGEPMIDAMFMVMMLGVLLAAEYFSYLHSRKKTDFYMSLPIKRNQQFLMGALVCMIIFVVPCILATAGEMIIGMATGYGTTDFLVNMLWRIICKILIFAAMWITMALAMIMTGNLVVALLGMGAFCSYIPIFLRYLVPNYQQFFFETYADVGIAAGAWYYFSPVSLSVGVAGRGFNWILDERINYFIGIILFIAIIGTLAFVLYLRRPAEAAGRAMAFEKANPAIRFAIVIPLTLYFGFFLSQMSGAETSKIWMVAGIIIGGILIHGIVESIFNFDLRKMFAKKKQLGLAITLCLGFVLAFQLNVDRFNSFVPEEADVERVVFSVNGENVSFYVGYVEMDDDAGVSGEAVGNVIQMVENAIELNQNIEAHDSEGALETIVVRYQMKNGSTKARAYYFDTENEENRALLDSVMGTEEFKKDYYSLYSKDLANVQEIYVDDTVTSEKLLFTEEEKQQFVDIYLKELSALTFSEMETIERIARIELVFFDSQREEYYIHSNFTETIAFLKEYGIEIQAPFEDAKVVSVEFYEMYYDDYSEPGIIIQDQEVLEEVKDQFVLRDFYGGDHIYGLRNTRDAHVQYTRGHRLDGKGVFIREDVENVLKAAAE